ncbi:hypothetical protein [Borrelia sp. P9F1]|uniref:hypothetical protein n=1 Tax=Borrelia sp. P9F1 TaxID=3058374 RepID=UPI002648C32C|nr:hypothetical protein [Borrelia sp. P9F1]WKC57601.1 hypothetical protein QYZ68_00005 [Borrelia sp. P9F1]
MPVGVVSWTGVTNFLTPNINSIPEIVECRDAIEDAGREKVYPECNKNKSLGSPLKYISLTPSLDLTSQVKFLGATRIEEYRECRVFYKRKTYC